MAQSFSLRFKLAVVTALSFGASPTPAQQPERVGAGVTGRVLDAITARPVPGALVTIEGSAIRATSDSAGRYALPRVAPGPQVLRAIRLGYAPVRHVVHVPLSGEVTMDLTLARSALSLRGIVVTADPVSRARGELGTASVIEGDAIRNYAANSLASLLELLPGVVLQPPGLDAVQQASIRSVPISPGGSVAGATASGPSAAALAAFGTQVILDGVPVSNNANLQSLGPRAELTLATGAGGGVDLRRFPASLIERLEVIRGIPSSRFGDLTNGAILIDTRAGVVSPELVLRYDPRTIEASIVGGQSLGASQTASLTANVARKRLAPGLSDDQGSRITAQAAHRLTIRRLATARDTDSDPRLLLDTRADYFQLFEDIPESPQTPGVRSRNRDAGFRVSERARLTLASGRRLELTAAFEGVRQQSFTQSPRLRPAMPFTDRTTPGRAVGKFVAGPYLTRVNVDGDPRHLYSRLELTSPAHMLALDHLLRVGSELRREWSGGPGYQFDIEFPPQSEFNGVQGFDRPRRYDAIPPLVTSSAYIDDRISHALGAMLLQLQGGVRVDLLHEGGSWFSSVRHIVLQPRLNVELAPSAWLRLRAGGGRVAKVPSLSDLWPAANYYDVVNVNWYANEPAERLAVLTTFMHDPTNRDLRYSLADKIEAGFEIDLGRGGGIAVVAFSDRIKRGVGVVAEPTFLFRDRFRLADTVPGTGRPPRLIEPPVSQDTVPVIIDRRANNLTLRGSGVEVTATLPELRPLRARVALQAAWVRNRLETESVEFGPGFSVFQLNESIARAPYWQGATRYGERLLLTSRLIHHQPDVGLVITGTFQHALREIRDDLGTDDTLAFAGYMTRGGMLVPVPVAERGAAQYRDLRESRRSLLPERQTGPVDWLFNLQVSKTLPLGGRLSFYAFNALDRIGNFGGRTVTPRLYPATRFGAEVTMPLAAAR